MLKSSGVVFENVSRRWITKHVETFTLNDQKRKYKDAECRVTITLDDPQSKHDTYSFEIHKKIAGKWVLINGSTDGNPNDDMEAIMRHVVRTYKDEILRTSK